MTRLRILIHRLRGMFLKRRRERELEEEIRTHLEMQIDDNLRQGMDPDDAHRAARRKFGGIDQVKESYRDRSGFPFLGSILQDLRYASRIWRKNPGFTLFVVCGLGLAIGANTAIFTIVNGDCRIGGYWLLNRGAEPGVDRPSSRAAPECSSQ
jgi:macrolide transport system ATP-binding/permease protein